MKISCISSNMLEVLVIWVAIFVFSVGYFFLFISFLSIFLVLSVLPIVVMNITISILVATVATIFLVT